LQFDAIPAQFDGKCYLILEGTWDFPTFGDRTNDFYVMVSDPSVAQNPAPTFLLYNTWLISST